MSAKLPDKGLSLCKQALLRTLDDSSKHSISGLINQVPVEYESKDGLQKQSTKNTFLYLLLHSVKKILK